MTIALNGSAVILAKARIHGRPQARAFAFRGWPAFADHDARRVSANANDFHGSSVGHPMRMSHSKARALYDSGAPVADVAAALGMKATAFRAYRKKRGWPLRPSRFAKRADAPTPANAPADAPTPAADAPADVPVIRRQLEQVFNSNLASLQKRLSGDGATDDIERNARLLASLVKTLAELRRLEALDPARGADANAEGHDDERPPRDLDTLRDELARALERLSEDARGTKPGG